MKITVSLPGKRPLGQVVLERAGDAMERAVRSIESFIVAKFEEEHIQSALAYRFEMAFIKVKDDGAS